MESPIYDDFLTVAFKEKMSINLDNIEFEYGTSAAKLLNKRKEMKETDELLNEKKKEFNIKMKELDERKQTFEKKQLQFKESLKEYDKDFKDILFKRERAAKRFANEAQIRKEKEGKIIEKTSILENMLTERIRLQKLVEQNIKYKQVLDKVIENADDFQEINDIISRHSTLVATKEELQKLSNKSQFQLIDEKQKLNECLETKDREVLILNNEITTLQKKYENMQAMVAHLESTWNQVKNASTKEALLAGQIKIISFNLFNVIRNFQKINNAEDKEIFDTISQLQKVKEYIDDLKDIVKEPSESTISVD